MTIKNLVTSMQVRFTVTADSMNCPLKKFVKYEMKTSKSVGRYTVRTVPSNKRIIKLSLLKLYVPKILLPKTMLIIIDPSLLSLIISVNLMKYCVSSIWPW